MNTKELEDFFLQEKRGNSGFVYAWELTEEAFGSQRENFNQVCKQNLEIPEINSDLPPFYVGKTGLSLNEKVDYYNDRSSTDHPARERNPVKKWGKNLGQDFPGGLNLNIMYKFRMEFNSDTPFFYAPDLVYYELECGLLLALAGFLVFGPNLWSGSFLNIIRKEGIEITPEEWIVDMKDKYNI